MKCSLCVLSLLEYNPGKFTVSLDRIWEKKQGTDEDLLYGGRNKKKKKRNRRKYSPHRSTICVGIGMMLAVYDSRLFFDFFFFLNSNVHPLKCKVHLIKNMSY